MAIISKQIGWGTESNLLWQILKQLNKLTAVIFGLKPKYKVFTALLTQNNDSNPTNLSIGTDYGSTLTIGVSYTIQSNDTTDFTNVGAPNNNVGTSFIAIGEIPNNQNNNDNTVVSYDSGAPIANILENTIGNIWFNYENIGNYSCNSNNLFTVDKTSIDIDSFGQNGYLNSQIGTTTDNSTSLFYIYTQKGDPQNGVLIKNRIEIRVYN